MRVGQFVNCVGNVITRAINALVVTFASVMLLAIGWQVFMRYVFNKPPSWTEELALLSFTWTTLLMLALGVRQAFHVRMDLLSDALPAAFSRWLERLVLLLVAGFGAYLANGGLSYVIGTATAKSAAIAYPIYALHAAAPVCGVLVCWFALERMLAPPLKTPPQQAAV